MKACLFAGCLAAACAAHAGVTVVENVSPGATNWPGSPFASTMANPAGTVAVGESFNSGNTSLGETFTVTTTNYILQTIDIYSGSSGGTGTGPGTNLVLNLYDLGPQIAPNPSPYSGSILGGNLFGSGAGLSIVYSPQFVDGVLEFDFSGADQVTLQLGHEYAFEMAGTTGTTPIWWERATSDTYAGGAAYRNESWINGTSARDFAMAVYGTPTTNSQPPAQPVCVIDWNNVHQRIDGFGASSAFSGNIWSAAQADMFFSTNNGIGTGQDGTMYPFTGIGLSLLRNQVHDGGYATASELGLMQMAQSRGARIWSAPWSPAAQFKDNLNVNGGDFLSASNQAYANQLAGYVAGLTNEGINLYALSVQNEPDVTASYPSCLWTAQQIHDFIPFLSSALAASNVGSTLIMIPESEHWESNTNLYTTAMNDPTVAPLVGIIANHNYDNTPPSGTPDPIPRYGKALWETETSILISGSNDPSITNAVYWAGRIHLFMTVAEANAWHYWWLMSFNTTGNEGLADTNWVATKRMYTLGNFSRFVRPGYYRIAANNNGGAQISAYKDTNSTIFAIVAINPGSTDINQTFTLTNVIATAVTPWITSTTLSLSNQPPVGITNSSFVYTLPALSVITFVGQELASPVLRITQQSPIQATLAWNAPPSVFTLQSASTLKPPVWNAYPGNPVVQGNLNALSVPITNAVTYFRLKY